MNKTFKTVTNIIIVVLAFLSVLFTAMGIFEFADGIRVYTASEDSLLYALEDQRYNELIYDYHRNLVSDTDSTETMEECYAIARYYEAAIDYKIAVQENDIELLKTAQEVMSLAESQMGELSYAKDEIDDLLEI